MTAYLTRVEVAAQLRVSPRLVSAFVAQERLRASRVGRRLLFLPADVEAFVASQATVRRRRARNVA